MDTTADRVYEAFVAISGGGGAIPDPMIEASEELGGAAQSAVKAMSAVGAAFERIAGVPGGLLGATAEEGASWSAVTARSADAVISALASAASGGKTAEATGGAMGSVQRLFGAGSLAGTVASAAGDSGGGGVLGTLESIGKGMLGTAGLVWNLFGGLFGGGDSEPAPALVKYALPPRIAFAGADLQGGVALSDYDQSGMPRVYSGGAEVARTGSGGAAPQITVNVQAMDARSFMDRSSEIAAAVREAMLNLNPINDVVNDL